MPCAYPVPVSFHPEGPTQLGLGDPCERSCNILLGTLARLPDKQKPLLPARSQASAAAHDAMRCTMNEETRWAGAVLNIPSSRDPDLPAWSTAVGKIVFDGRWYKLVINYRMHIDPVLYLTARNRVHSARTEHDGSYRGIKLLAISGIT